MRQLAAVLFVLASACSAGSTDEDGIDQTFTAQMAGQALEAAIPNSSELKIHAICGPSAGTGLYSNDDFQAMQSDGISNGRSIFYSATDDSEPNLLFRDAGGEYLSAIDDGGSVEVIGPDRNIWVVRYPTTGVVEVHNLIKEDGRLLDLWTANKPGGMPWGASAKVLTAPCFRP